MNNLLTNYNYEYRGARALIMLHEKHLRSFLKTWIQAKENDITLPKTSDPDYESLEKLLIHVLSSAGGYITWICKNLNLKIPEIKSVPAKEDIRNNAEEYINHLVVVWNTPLHSIKYVEFEKIFTSNWGVKYSIDAMMEHAVMHPVRHEFQLMEILNSKLICE